MKEYFLDAYVHIKAVVEAESKADLQSIAEQMVEGTYDGTYEICDIEVKGKEL